MSSTKPTSSSSISDLAPFVAAVLKDEVVTDLNKDIEELREREDKRLRVEITGRSGSPVYYQASLKDGETDPRHDDFWMVNFEPKKNDIGEDIVLPLNLIKDLEVRLGGIIMIDMKYAENDGIEGVGILHYVFEPHNEEEPQMYNTTFGYQGQSYCPIVCGVNCKVGPILFDDFFHDLELARTETPLDLIITGIEFNKSKIGSLLSMK